MYGLKGLGDVTFPEAMGPPVDPNVPVQPPDVQQQIADVWSYLGSQPGTVATVAPATSQTFSQWLNANAGKAAIGVAAVLALVFVAKAGR
jgi:hypothetical protein